jgi:alkanesulfonate monooxygenase SsuD/methylene tetrahydromethanopterin reductase-like flavin-dependent oxidoreductase (luciferase family)
VIERIRLATTVLLGPLRSNAVMLAKECATLDHLADGRFWLGIGLGARQDDYEVIGISWDTRGAALTRQLEQIRSTWEGDDYEFLGDYTSQIVESVATNPGDGAKLHPGVRAGRL